MNISEVKDLNARIESIQTQRTKIETRREMLMANLGKALEEYANAYGVDMRSSKISTTMKAVEKEKSAVEALIKEEFELKSKVVSAIEGGDIATAKKLLGVEDTEEEFSAEDEETVSEEVAEIADSSKEEDEDDVPWDDDDISESDEGFEEATSWNNSKTEYSSSDEEKSSVGEIASGDDWGDLTVEDDTDEQVIMTSGKSFLEAVAKKEDKSSSSLDFEDDDLDDFGFGNITKGTKFGKE